MGNKNNEYWKLVKFLLLIVAFIIACCLYIVALIIVFVQVHKHNISAWDDQAASQ